MATVGQALTAPESGWKRYDDSDTKIEKDGIWSTSVNANSYNGKSNYSSDSNANLKIRFKGSKIRIIAILINSSSPSIPIRIDNEDYTYNGYSTSIVNQCLLYEKTGMNFGEHEVIISHPKDGKNIFLDAIDIDSDGELLDYYRKRLIIKNPTTNQHYSLADKTLIHLPDTSDKNIILHGIEAGKEIQLDEDFDKINYPVNEGLRNTVETMVKPLSIKFE